MFVICGRSVSRNTPLVARIKQLLGENFAGLYDEIGKDTPYENVIAARDKAREVGRGPADRGRRRQRHPGRRIIAILLAEKEPVEKLITQYPPGMPAISPKLMAPKLPIINILTAGSSAQNRAGSPMKKEGREGRMEFFDPKTRPVALFWDRKRC